MKKYFKHQKTLVFNEIHGTYFIGSQVAKELRNLS